VNLRDHFLNPPNVGELADADAAGEAGSLSCGGMLRLSLRIDEALKVVDARFQAIGCSLLTASASILTETVKGETIAEAAAIAQSTAWIEPDAVPPDKTGCITLCRDALLSAIQHFSDTRREEWNGDDPLICSCFGVSERTIEREIKVKNLSTIAEVTNACNAGAGCRSCYSLITDILDAVSSKQ
jgi:NifU-like protein